jgi:sugar/nucleoside kinase (ribokinase family)
LSSQLLCVGDLNLDVAITLDHPLGIGSDTAGTIELYGGGSAANVAAWAAKAGATSRFVGVTGDDHTARFLTEELRDHGVAVDTIERQNSRGRSVAAIIGPDGERSLVSDHETVVTLALGDFSPSWLDDVGWLHLTAYSYITTHSRTLFEELKKQAVARSIPLSIDPSAAHLLRTNCDHNEVIEAFGGATVLIANRDEAEYLSGASDPESAAGLLLELAETVAVKCGQDGAFIASRGQPTIHVDAKPAIVANTLGCGDAFAGGLIAGLLEGRSLRSAADLAVTLGAAAAELESAR